MHNKCSIDSVQTISYKDKMLDKYFQNKTIAVLGIHSAVARVFVKRILAHTLVPLYILQTEKDIKNRPHLLCDQYFTQNQRSQFPTRLIFVALSAVGLPRIDYLFDLFVPSDFTQTQKTISYNIFEAQSIRQHLANIPISTIVLLSSIYAHNPGYVAEETTLDDPLRSFHSKEEVSEAVQSMPNAIEGWKWSLNYLEQSLCTLAERVEVIRVGLVGPTLCDHQGYAIKFNVFTHLCHQIGRGLITSVYGKGSNKIDVVPADYLANYAVMVAVKPHRHFQQSIKKVINTHNFTTSTRNPLSLKKLLSYNKDSWFAHERKSSSFSILQWPYSRKLNSLTSVLPSVASKLGTWLDVPSWRIESHKLNIVSKLNESTRLRFQYFLDNEWVTPSNYSIDLHQKLTEEQEKAFTLNVNEINWEQYLLVSTRGIKKYLLHEPVQSYKPASLDLLARGDSYFSDVMWAFTQGKTVKALRSPQYTQQVLNSKAVKDAINSIVDQRMLKLENTPLSYHQAQQELSTVAQDMCKQMFSDYNMASIRLFAWFLHKVFRTIYEKVVIDKSAFLKLKAQNSQIPYIIIPTHRSYIDFLIMSYIFFGHGLQCPHIAAAQDFLSMALIHLLLRRSGAFFIKRNQQRHRELYSAIMREYVSLLLVDNHSLEFFIEGTRSRVGKMLSPKLGMLKIVVENVLSQRIADATVLPICINYEKVLQGDSFTYQMMGENKVKESLGRLLKAVDVLKENYGRIYIEVCEGISVKKYFDQRKHLPFNTALREFGDQIVYTLANNSVITTPAVVATTVLMHRKGISDESLTCKVMAIIKELNSRGVKVSSTQSDSSLNISSTLALLSDVLSKSKKDMFEVELTFDQFSFVKLFKLVYYRNTLSHIFFEQALIYTSLTTFGHDTILNPTIHINQLYHRVQFLTGLLRSEYYLANCNESKERVIAVIRRSKGLAIDELQRVFLRDKQMMELCCSLVWPLIQSYWITALYLFKIKKEAMEVQRMIKEIQWFAQTLITERALSFGEAISSDTIKNAIGALTGIGHIEIKNNQMHAVKDEQQIKKLVENIGIYLKSSYAKSVKSMLDNGLGSISLDFPFLSKL